MTTEHKDALYMLERMVEAPDGQVGKVVAALRVLEIVCRNTEPGPVRDAVVQQALQTLDEARR